MRGVWIAASLIGAIGCTLLAGFCLFAAYESRDNASFSQSAVGWAFTFIAVAIACALALFRSRAHIERDMTEEEGKPAPWIEEMRARQERDKR
jgi:hypothetical protein